MVLGDAVATLETFEPCFKVYNLVSVHPKSIITWSLFTLKASNLVKLVSCFKVYNLVSVHPKSIKLGQIGQFIDWLKIVLVPCAISEWPI